MINTILGKLKELANSRENIALHEPFFEGNEWAYVKDCLDTGWVSSAGQYVDRFERDLEDFTGIKHAVAVVNGTAALHIALKIAGVGADDEVLVPALTFVATANAISHCWAIPHFVDNEEITLGLDPAKLDYYLGSIALIKGQECINKVTGRRIKAVVPMHTFGHPVDMDPLVEVCSKYKLQIVEDAAESIGSKYKGKHTGSWGKASVLSFNGNKTITTGGGGAIITNDKGLANLARHMTTTAKLPHPWSFYHDMVGYNYRMPNINAALGCAQLEQLPGFIIRKRSLADRYHRIFKDVEGVKVFKEADFAFSNYWLNVLILDEDKADLRDQVLETTNKMGIMTRPAWVLMHKLPMYFDCPRMDLSQSENLEKRIINLPSSVFLGEGHE